MLYILITDIKPDKREIASIYLNPLILLILNQLNIIYYF